MAWSPNWPTGLDAYGSFPGQPYTDGSEYILAAYGSAWVLAIANLEAYIGYGTGAASPIYSSVYSVNYGTMAARFVHVETVAQAATAAVGIVVPIGGIIEWGTASAPTNYLILHGQTVTNGAITYPTLAGVYPSWVSGSDLIMPDSRDRFGMGAGGAHAAFSTGGSANFTLSTTNIPLLSTSVSVTDPGHFHAAQPGFAVVVETSSAVGLSSASIGTFAAANVGAPNTDTKTTGISGTVTMGHASPASVDTTPPFLALHKIVRAA